MKITKVLGALVRSGVENQNKNFFLYHSITLGTLLNLCEFSVIQDKMIRMLMLPSLSFSCSLHTGQYIERGDIGTGNSDFIRKASKPRK